MNQRIQELAKLSTPLDEKGQKVRGLNSEYHDKWMEKFAELIVQECANAIQKEKDTGLYNVQQMAGMTISKIVIKDHFGVE